MTRTTMRTTLTTTMTTTTTTTTKTTTTTTTKLSLDDNLMVNGSQGIASPVLLKHDENCPVKRRTAEQRHGRTDEPAAVWKASRADDGPTDEPVAE